MELRRISAHYIFPGHINILKYGIIEFDTTGRITDLIDTGGVFNETAGLEFYSGILTPGFIISPFLKDLSELTNDIPDFPFIGEFFTWLGSIMKVRIAEDSVESQRILQYIMILQENYPTAGLNELISKVTYEAACTFGIQHEYGSFLPGRKPGINLLTHLDMQKLRITEDTKVLGIV